MAKIKKVENIGTDGVKYHHDQYFYFCHGCGYEHAFGLKGEGGYHEFNMDLDNPTVSPSLLQDFEPNHERRCHSFIIEGRIHYLSDCRHSLAGLILELPNIY